MRHSKFLATTLGALALLSCTDGPAPPPPPPCDAECRDGTALRALREGMKLAFNLTLQGKPVGEHDQTFPCLEGGTLRIYGSATSNAVQGSTDVMLTYVLTSCGYAQKDNEADESYSMTLSGTITQRGTLAVQPSATTALIIKSDGLTFSGTIYDPPEPFNETACVLDVVQNGNSLAGTMCGRKVGVTL